MIVNTPFMESEELLEIFMLSKNPTAIYTSDEIVIQAATDSMIDLWGKDRSVIGQRLQDAIPELKDQVFINMLKAVWRTGQTIGSNAIPAELNRDGILKTYYFDFEYRAVKNAAGEVICILHTATDVTGELAQREQLEAKELLEQQLLMNLATSNEQLQALNEEYLSTNEELSSLNEEYRAVNDELLKINQEADEARNTLGMAMSAAGITTWNAHIPTGKLTITDRGRVIYGLADGADLTIKEFYQLIIPADRVRVQRGIQRAVEQHTNFDEEYLIEAEDETKPKWVKLNGKGYYDAAGNLEYLTGTLYDITERKLDDIRKNDFIAMVSHELKTPLTSLQGYVQMIALKARRDGDGYLTGIMDRAINQVRKMTSMINGFLNVSKLEGGKIHLDIQEFDLDALIHEVAKEGDLLSSSHSVTVQDCSLVKVKADRDKIAQVLTNLISNAIKYSPKANVVQVSCAHTETEVIISVKDEGMGIKQEDIDNLFTRFYRVSSQQTQTISGFGIGLYLCAEIVDRHNGSIWIESEIGQGSTFHFSLPLPN
jgi:two-component system sensor histidine kinase VicK